jgi:pectin methylesterase-like acyl-CoA thioesterase
MLSATCADVRRTGAAHTPNTTEPSDAGAMETVARPHFSSIRAIRKKMIEKRSCDRLYLFLDY